MIAATSSGLSPFTLQKDWCRREFLYAADHLHLLRRELLRMLGWTVGFTHGFTFSLGKNYKFIDHYLHPHEWKALLATYEQGSPQALWKALDGCMALFADAALRCSKALGCAYPRYEANIRRYVTDMRRKYAPEA